MSIAREFNFDGLVGPSHNYAGLSVGNVASSSNINTVSNPKAAALQGLAKMRALSDRGFAQALLPPHSRPNFQLLRQIGFSGTDADVLARAYKDAPVMLASAYSAASMWTANAATVSPSTDTSDGRVHFTVANLNNKLHRSYEHKQSLRSLQAIFHDNNHFVVHEALPSTPALSDEGAANHSRLCAHHGAAGVEMFVFGRTEFDAKVPTPKRFPARQTKEACHAIARLHGLHDQRAIFVQQHPDVIDAGVFHNDVISVANENVLFYHQHAFLDEDRMLADLRRALSDVETDLCALRVNDDHVSVADAVSTYLFNSQILTKQNGKMALLVPQECQENQGVSMYLQQLLASGSPIDELICLNLSQSMRNGGGPACLRLRVVLTDTQEQTMHQGVVMTEQLHARLVMWVEKYYRDRLTPADLADPLLALEINAALDALTDILALPNLYKG